MDERAGLRFCCSQTPKDGFSHAGAHITHLPSAATTYLTLTLCIVGYFFMLFLSSTDFSEVNKSLSATLSECQTVWI